MVAMARAIALAVAISIAITISKAIIIIRVLVLGLCDSNGNCNGFAPWKYNSQCYE